MNVKEYLKRIEYRGSRSPNLETLTALTNAHVRSVPFENLSIHIGERINLNIEWLFEKIVTRKRGGFCYELNGLFAWLLEEMGFRVEMLSAQVHSLDGDSSEYGPDFDHMVLKVELDEPWLVDIGFGRAYNEPLALRQDEVQEQGDEKFRLTQDGDYYYYWRHSEKWIPEYRFTLTPYKIEDYKKRCHYSQMSPQSLFTKNWFVTHQSTNGRETLHQEGRDFRFITTSSTGRHEVVIQGLENAMIVLEDVFGIPETIFDRMRKRKPKKKRSRK